MAGARLSRRPAKAVSGGANRLRRASYGPSQHRRGVVAVAERLPANAIAELVGHARTAFDAALDPSAVIAALVAVVTALIAGRLLRGRRGEAAHEDPTERPDSLTA
jgi:hypothetical protein